MKKYFCKLTTNYCLVIITSFLFAAMASAQCPQACFGTSNIAFGNNAGNTAVTTGSLVTSVGSSAGAANTSGDLNAFFGANAGLSNTTGSYNSFFGAEAGQHITTGSYNICIGKGAGPSIADSAVSNRLYIDVEESDEPLIYGEFDNDLVRINGTFEATGGLINPSSVYLKEQFTPVSHQHILKQVGKLDIQEWSYKRYPEVRHMGPTAEDFSLAFGHGKNEQTISTIDADGVVLVAIQALHEKLLVQEKLLLRAEALAAKNEELQARFETLVELAGKE